MGDPDRVKKIASERRKEQNRRAQKNYRKRQLQRLRMLETLIESREVDSAQVGSAGDGASRNCSASAVASLEMPPRASLRASPFCAPLLDAGTTTPQSLVSAMVAAPSPTGIQWEDEPTVPSGRASAHPALSPPASIIHRELDQLLQDDTGAVNEAARASIVSGRFTVQDVLRAGLQALSRDATLQTAAVRARPPRQHRDQLDAQQSLRTDRILVIENRLVERAYSLNDLQANCIRVHQVTTTAAARCNAAMLGVSFERLCDENSESPFFDGLSGDSSEAIAFSARLEHSGADLLPTLAQRRYSHHPWIDTLPSPTLRQKLLEGLSLDPPLVDEDDFCNDLALDGLICWGSMRNPSNPPLGSGAPWDVRSWEAQPWFLRKWWFVLGGADGEIFQASKWWNEMRGDRLSYAW